MVTKKPTAKKLRDRTVREWEYKNIVHGAGYYTKGGTSYGGSKSLSGNMQSRGYDAMRVSPSITTKYGLKYRKVFGTEVSPNYNMSKNGQKYYPKVTWHLQGYIKAGKTKGSYMLNAPSLRQNFLIKPLKQQLMIK